ncbi:hypothetical protein [Stenotrophomonas sp. YIM B13575]|uniref:hypothetical protein n=1 Tax=Stenotrophomonas sp. YIM B13575 TaxID=3366314 RepID=UPI0036A94A43
MPESTQDIAVQSEAASTRYLECPLRHEFMEVHEQGGRLSIRSGTIGMPCLVVHASFKSVVKAQAVQQKCAETWLSKGYVECERRVDIVEGSVADELFCDERESHPLLGAFFNVIGADTLKGLPQRLALFRNGLLWHQDFDFERLGDLGLHAGVIVDGDVSVSGVLTQLTYSYPGFILVSGDVIARSLGHRDSSMRILGDVHVENIIYGEYNDGSLCIEGSAYGQAFISDDHYMYAAGEYHIAVATDGQNWGCLSPELFDSDDDECPSLSAEAIQRFMVEGRNPYVAGASLKYREVSTSLPAPPAVHSPSSFMVRIQACIVCNDVEGLTSLIEHWQERDLEWLIALAGRLAAPSTTVEQRERLLAVVRSLDPSPEQVELWTELVR